MKLKNIQITDGLVAVNKLVNAPLPFKVKLNVSRTKKALSEVAELYEESFQEIIQECVQRDEEGNPVVPLDENGNPAQDKVSIDKDKVVEFNTKITELNQTEVEVDVNTIEVTPETESALSTLSDFDPTPVLWLFDD